MPRVQLHSRGRKFLPFFVDKQHYSPYDVARVFFFLRERENAASFKLFRDSITAICYGRLCIYSGEF